MVVSLLLDVVGTEAPLDERRIVQHLRQQLDAFREQRPPAGVAVALLLGLAWSSMHSSVQTWATQVYPAQRAATVSLFAGSLFAGSALGTLLLGGLAEDGRFGAAFLALAVVTVPLGVVGAVARARWEST